MHEVLEKRLREWREQLSSGKGKTILVICGFLGILLLCLPEIIPKRTVSAVPTISADVFVKETESRLQTLVESIEGAGACRVMVTLENGIEYVYATEQKSNSDRQEDISGEDTRLSQRDDNESSAILIDTDSGREGLLVTEIQPTVRGVVVVCAGGDNEAVRERVSEAVTVALNISSKRVCVTKLS